MRVGTHRCGGEVGGRVAGRLRVRMGSVWVGCLPAFQKHNRVLVPVEDDILRWRCRRQRGCAADEPDRAAGRHDQAEVWHHLVRWRLLVADDQYLTMRGIPAHWERVNTKR